MTGAHIAVPARAGHSAIFGASEARTSGPAHTLSVIIPTRNEAGNIVALLQRLEPVLGRLPGTFEVVFVDDSTDDTPRVIAAVSRDARWVRLLHRSAGQRHGGLGGAVLAGLQAVDAQWVAVMDGDLQHPPEVLGEMFQRAVNTGADVVVASRYTGSGRSNGLSSAARVLVSRGATVATKLMFPSMLRDVSDPMSGFFLVRVGALRLAGLRPNGFKILLELLAGMTRPRVGEVPFVFDSRHTGDSKADAREGLRFAGQLLRTRLAAFRHGGAVLRLAQFGLVGAVGLAVNTAVFAAMLRAEIPYLVAAFVSTQVATGFNFVMSERVVFAGRVGGRRWVRAGVFFAIADLGFAVSGPLMLALINLAAVPPLIANVLAIGALMVARFLVADRFIWATPEVRIPRPRTVVSRRGAARLAGPTGAAVEGARP
jgi:Glycosyltransferases involved in cell wall biogenesis